jgi:hypothetical protein
MDSRGILYSTGRNDECMTLPYAVKPIIKYIPQGSHGFCRKKGKNECQTEII